MDLEEMAKFKKLLQMVAINAKQAGLEISEERWLSMGVHLLSAIRRVKKGERLPTVDQFIMDQVSSNMMELSRKILRKIDSEFNDETETVLLALHFETAKNSN
ncbi:PRD domain-containing protein [Pelosinus sp. UFO1]|uniref:PRD domain-containing protein n=1 Tax=Pelosinus sp. UFO1 TaxID=484770 RepID=UPI000A9E02A5|nr:PRD domain-containing protein [Pelosinus sp. UFO1]